MHVFGAGRNDDNGTGGYDNYYPATYDNEHDCRTDDYLDDNNIAPER